MKGRKYFAAVLLVVAFSQVPAFFPCMESVAFAKVEKKDKAKAQEYYAAAVDAMKNGDLKSAAAGFMEASSLDKENPLYFMFSGDMLLKLKQYPAAMRAYQSSIDNYSNGNKKQRDKIRAKSYLGLAEASRKSGDAAAAEKYARELIDYYPEDYRGYLALGRAYAEKSETYSDAIRELEKSIDLKKDQLPAYLALASIYSKQDNVQKVIDTYEMACDYRPLDESLKMSLAQVYFSYKSDGPHYKDAKRVLQSIIDVNNKNAMAYYYLALACTLDDDRDGAEQALSVLVGLNQNLADRLYQEIRAYNRKHQSSDNVEVVVRDAVDGEIITLEEKEKENIGKVIDKQIEKLEQKS